MSAVEILVIGVVLIVNFLMVGAIGGLEARIERIERLMKRK